jgi:membrane associated rhomboid family serine protease
MARFVFRRRPFFTLVLIAILAGPPAGFLMLLFRDAQAGAPLFPGLIFAAVVFGTIAIVACGLRAWTRPKQAPAIELRDEHALFPASAGSKRVKTIRYDEFLSVNVIGKGRWANLLIGTERRSFVYPVSRFELGAAAVGELCAELRRRIAALPDGISRLGEIKERESISANATKSTPSVSWAMLALVAAAYIWTSLNGALDDPFGLTAYGANVPVLVGDGEWYRLLAANFLHVNLIHAYLNALGILILGMLLERLIGSWRLLCIYLVSAAAGALASTWASVAVLSVGASTAVFGLLGALALVNWRFRRDPRDQRAAAGDRADHRLLGAYRRLRGRGDRGRARVPGQTIVADDTHDRRGPQSSDRRSVDSLRLRTDRGRHRFDRGGRGRRSARRPRVRRAAFGKVRRAQ